ncbi:EscE/YscE/SsaE family type III secretion system needle protein co-chaperone [Pseudomonas sp. CAM1A]|uniref:EscE/YscE/SsaE family type III secretion system needle protein co-chaperone n=1 Tax=Pseudomonas sp. CAM1A TaxID=3231717 RepID=UPI0039C69DCC
MMDELLQETRDPLTRAWMYRVLEQARQARAEQMSRPLPPTAFQALHDERTALEAALNILEKLKEH